MYINIFVYYIVFYFESPLLIKFEYKPKHNRNLDEFPEPNSSQDLLFSLFPAENYKYIFLFLIQIVNYLFIAYFPELYTQFLIYSK